MNLPAFLLNKLSVLKNRVPAGGRSFDNFLPVESTDDLERVLSACRTIRVDLEQEILTDLNAMFQGVIGNGGQ